MELFLQSTADLDPAMPRLLEGLAGRRKIALYGAMGAGKTTLTSAFCRFLGVQGHTASPTFSLINAYRYTLSDGTQALVHHLDLYRLNTLPEALDIGLEDLLYDPWYCIIEWPQLIENLLPQDVAKIHFEIVDETTRRLVIL